MKLAIYSVMILCYILLFFPSNSHSTDLFRLNITVGDQAVRQSTNSLLNVADFFENVSLDDLFDNYTPTSEVFAGVDLRGVATIISYPGNSSELVFSIPRRNFEVRFDGGTRDRSAEQFGDWLKGEFENAKAPRSALTKLLQIFVKDSPVDPVAGNPNSLLTRMFVADYNAGITGPFISSKTKLPVKRNLFNVGGDFTFFEGGSFTGQSYSVPLNYKYNFKNHPKLSLIVDLPIILTDTQNAWSYMGSLGLGAQYRPTKWWSLTPMARIGGVGSFDIGALAAFVTGSATNYFQYSFPKTRVGFATLGGISTTIDGIKIGGWDLTYDLTNYILRNGGDVVQEMDFKLFGKQAAFKFFLNHTKFWGNSLYLNSFFETGIGLITINKIADGFVEALDFSFTYTSGVTDDYNDYRFKVSYRF